MKTRHSAVPAVFVALLALAACGRDEPTSGAANAQAASPAPAAAASGSATAATGQVIEVRMVTDDKGNYFDPAEVTARPGDILRFTLASGVHNVSFPAAENANASGLPTVGGYLQLPGQTHDVTVDLPKGSYHFQCDPHVALGMKGTLIVE